jgi:hypothetical protein
LKIVMAKKGVLLSLSFNTAAYGSVRQNFIMHLYLMGQRRPETGKQQKQFGMKLSFHFYVFLGLGQLTSNYDYEKVESVLFMIQICKMTFVSCYKKQRTSSSAPCQIVNLVIMG